MISAGVKKKKHDPDAVSIILMLRMLRMLSLNLRFPTQPNHSSHPLSGHSLPVTLGHTGTGFHVPSEEFMLKQFEQAKAKIRRVEQLVFSECAGLVGKFKSDAARLIKKSEGLATYKKQLAMLEYLLEVDQSNESKAA